MGELNTDRVVRVPPREIDPNFAIPIGVDGMVYTAREFVEDEGEGLDELVEEEELAVPEILGVTQTIRYTDEGNVLVDIEIEVEDVPGIQYDVRKTRVRT